MKVRKRNKLRLAAAIARLAVAELPKATRRGRERLFRPLCLWEGADGPLPPRLRRSQVYTTGCGHGYSLPPMVGGTEYPVKGLGYP